MKVGHPQHGLASRFRMLREKAGLSREKVAAAIGTSVSCIWDIESADNELMDAYSPAEVQQLCLILGVSTDQLFGAETGDATISEAGLVTLVLERCRSRGITLEEFEDRVGWKLSAFVAQPDCLLDGITVEGLRWLCRELEIDWHRVMKQP